MRTIGYHLRLLSAMAVLAVSPFACQADRGPVPGTGGDRAVPVSIDRSDPECGGPRDCFCSGTLPQTAGLSAVGITEEDLAAGVPCVVGDFDGDGDDDYAFPGAGYDCIRRVPVRVVILEDAAVRDTATIDSVACLYRYPASPEVGEFGEPASDRDGLMEPGEGGDTDIYLYEGGRFVHRKYPSDREATSFTERAIHKAATTPAGRLDPALPVGERFFDWLERVCGSDCRWETELNDCGEATGDPALDRERDLPACVSFSGRHPANVQIGIDVSVGTFEKGFVGEPRVRRVYLICGGQRQGLDAPSGLPAALDSLAGLTASCKAARSGPGVPESRPDPGAPESVPGWGARSFAEWCRDGSAPSSVRHSVRVLLAMVGSDDCAETERALQRMERLRLTNVAVTEEFGLDAYAGDPPPHAVMIAERPLTDLRPLGGFTGLRELWADGNQVGDLAPLTTLQNLEVLRLNGSRPCDLGPLRHLRLLKHLALDAGCVDNFSPVFGLRRLERLELNNGRLASVEGVAELSNLKYLALNGHEIADPSPLAGLRGLENLYLSNNRISDIDPLAGLERLRHLRLIGNAISDVTPLAELTGLRTLWLDENRITDVSSLSSLVNLELLSLAGNPIQEPECPLPPPHHVYCVF